MPASGRAPEAGAGAPSILASALLPDVAHRLNATVKYREPFRPFPPVVVAALPVRYPGPGAVRHAKDYFTLDQSSQFMSFASPVTDLTRSRIPAVVHVNGTARVQTVTPAQNPFLATVLAEPAAAGAGAARRRAAPAGSGLRERHPARPCERL